MVPAKSSLKAKLVKSQNLKQQVSKVCIMCVTSDMPQGLYLYQQGENTFRILNPYEIERILKDIQNKIVLFQECDYLCCMPIPKLQKYPRIQETNLIHNHIRFLCLANNGRSQQGMRALITITQPNKVWCPRLESLSL